MALTNIELYEALKKDVSEESARMIAEAVPKAQDIATNAAVARVEGKVDELKGYIDSRVYELKGYMNSRLLRFTLAFFVPMWAMTAGLLGVLFTRI